MKVIKATQQMLETRTLVLGFQGENLRTQLRIDCAATFAEYPNATPALAIKPPTGATYPVFVERDGTEVVWNIVANNLILKGNGELQLTFYKDNVIAKTVIGYITVNRSLQIDGEMPDVVATWIENANRKLAEVDAQIVELEGMVDTATDAATRAEQSASTASAKAEQAAGSAATATEKATEATNAAGTATAKAAEAALSATQASNSAVSAADSERGATAKAAEATTAAGTATAKAGQATEAAQTATEKAGDASASARAAQTSATDAAASATAASESETAAKASETAASTSATQAAQSAQGASADAQTATQKATEASQSATDAETFAGTATTKAAEAAASAQAASDAKTAVEQTAEQLADSLEQIAQNTQDIADHEQYAEATYAKKTDLYKKADIIHNTASGAIASFPDGAEMPVDEVTAQINPVQDLHGYDNPWPAGGGKNKLPNENGTYKGTTGNNIYIVDSESPVSLPAGTYYIKYFADKSTGLALAGFYLSINGGTASRVGTNHATQETVESFVLAEQSNITLRLYSSTTGFNEAKYRFMLTVEDSTNIAFSPYSNICPISGFDGLTVTRTGKNLLNESVKTQTASYVYFNSTGDGSEKTMTLPAGTYTISVSYTGTVKAHINVFRMNPYERIAVAYSATSLTFTLTKTEDILLWMQNSDFSIQDIGTIQLELGSTPTAYEPYQGETYEVEFPTEAGTVYGGSLTIAEDGSGVLTVDRFLYVYDGTEKFAKSSTALNGFYNNLQNNPGWTMPHSWPTMLNYGTGVAISTEISSMFAVTRNADEYKTIYGRCFLDSGMNFDVPPEVFGTTIESFKKKLAELYAAGTPVSVFAKITAPITYTLTASQIRTLLGENNLWHDANGDISVGYKADTKLYIDNKIAELVARIVNS